MWIFTEMGFFSLTRSRVEPDMIQARARSLEDARALKLYIERTLDRVPKLIETPSADYIARVILTPSEAAVIMAAMVENIEYDNFKSHIGRTPQSDKLPALHDIWHIMHEYQQAKLKRDNRRPRDPIAALADWAGEPPQARNPKTGKMQKETQAQKAKRIFNEIEQAEQERKAHDELLGR